MDVPFKARPHVAQADIHNEMTKTNTNTYPNTTAAFKCGITTTTIATGNGLVAVTKKSPTMPRKRSSDSVEEWECQEPITVDPVKPSAPLKRRFDAIAGGRDEWAVVAPMADHASAPGTSTAMIPAAFRLDSKEFGAPPALGDLPENLNILPVENQIDLSEDVPTSMAPSDNMMTWNTAQMFDGMNMMVPTHMPAALQTGATMQSDGGPLKRARRGSKSHNQWPVPNEQTSTMVMMPSGNQQWGWETPAFTAVAVAPTASFSDSQNTTVTTTKPSPEMVQCMTLGGSPVSHTDSPHSAGNASPELQSLFSRSSSSNDGGNLSDDGVEPCPASQVDEEAVMVEAGETAEDALLRANRVIRGLRAALAMNQQRCAELEAQLSTSESGSPQHSPPPRQPSPPQLQLRVSSKVEDVWYADRPFPAFNVELVDMAADGHPVQTR